MIVADYVLAVYRDLILLAAPRRKPRRSMVHALGKPVLVVYITRVLDADAVRVGVERPVSFAASLRVFLDGFWVSCMIP